MRLSNNEKPLQVHMMNKMHGLGKRRARHASFVKIDVRDGLNVVKHHSCGVRTLLQALQGIRLGPTTRLVRAFARALESVNDMCKLIECWGSSTALWDPGAQTADVPPQSALKSRLRV